MLFAASLEGLIAVASTGLWASIDCLLVTGDEDLDLLITAAVSEALCTGICHSICRNTSRQVVPRARPSRKKEGVTRGHQTKDGLAMESSNFNFLATPLTS